MANKPPRQVADEYLAKMRARNPHPKPRPQQPKHPNLLDRIVYVPILALLVYVWPVVVIAGMIYAAPQWLYSGFCSLLRAEFYRAFEHFASAAVCLLIGGAVLYYRFIEPRRRRSGLSES